mgnify:CR=1 FL=1
MELKKTQFGLGFICKETVVVLNIVQILCDTF